MTLAASVPPRVAGHPTYVVRAGRGVRRALFIHCTLGHSGTWAGVQAGLLDKLSMTAFDRPSHGNSAAWTGEGGALGLHTLTMQIAGRLIDKRADVIAHSYGVTVALRLAMERPELVRTLTLIEPPLFALAAGSPAQAAHAAAMAGFDAALAAGDRAGAAQIFQAAMNPDTPWHALSERARDRLAGQIDRIAEERGVTMDDVAGLAAPGRLEALRQPVLLIEGSASPPIVREVQGALAGRLPDARRVVAIGAGHMAPLTHPQNVAGEIATFLKV
jgi:lipase